ncbi:helix-turn-helix domain-containing protein [uncultured Lactobacillus sp.]|uniref:MerR family transcriptional regulator n=1 Tax=uncultured Lactobacillus sp. TaxID=153152 RepID=UPI002804AAA3|nr:helix-turn-helix domain-containing protein [uncultured Lactobacillus sp.]
MFSIGKMAEYCHTSVQTLRYYSKIGLLKPNYQDPDTGYRYYRLDQIFQFTIIKYLQSANLSLEEIKEIMSNENPNMTEFWKNQELEIQERIKQERKALSLAHFQQKQVKKLKILKDNLDRGTYIRTISSNIIEMPLKKIVTPADIPDNVISKLDEKILEAGLLPNFEYCFAFRGDYYSNLQDIHYLSMFKEINTKSTDSHKQEGDYLCISFMWNREKYLDYLNQLMDQAKEKYDIHDPLVIEDSFPLNYNQQQLSDSSNSIAELRIKL